MTTKDEHRERIFLAWTHTLALLPVDVHEQLRLTDVFEVDGRWAKDDARDWGNGACYAFVTLDYSSIATIISTANGQGLVMWAHEDGGKGYRL
jgi:hypothetical protein